MLKHSQKYLTRTEADLLIREHMAAAYAIAGEDATKVAHEIIQRGGVVNMANLVHIMRILNEAGGVRAHQCQNSFTIKLSEVE